MIFSFIINIYFYMIFYLYLWLFVILLPLYICSIEFEKNENIIDYIDSN